MDFKISDTNKGKKSLIYDGFIYRIDGVLKVERQQLRSQVKRKATDDLTWRPSKIIRTELHKFADKLIIGSGDVRSIAQSLYRERRKVYPILSKSR